MEEQAKDIEHLSERLATVKSEVQKVMGRLLHVTPPRKGQAECF